MIPIKTKTSIEPIGAKIFPKLGVRPPDWVSGGSKASENAFRPYGGEWPILKGIPKPNGWWEWAMWSAVTHIRALSGHGRAPTPVHSLSQWDPTGL